MIPAKILERPVRVGKDGAADLRVSVYHAVADGIATLGRLLASCPLPSSSARRGWYLPDNPTAVILQRCRVPIPYTG
ncbi:MAG: hypothetical protein ACK56I_11735, partial [bacterium]